MEDRGFAVGTHHTGFPIGQFFGPLLIGAILTVATWRAAFLLIPLIAIPIMIAQLVLARRRNLERVNGWIDEHEMTPSVTVEQIEGERWENPWGKVKEALAYRNVRLAVVMNFLFLFAEFGIASFLTLQLTREAGMSLGTAAVVSGASGLTGWVGQIVWGTVSDHKGRKFSLGILAVGLALSALALIFISNGVTAWIILLGWGVFRNSPYPVLYSAVIDTVSDAASSGMGLMIGVGLGISGTIVGSVSGNVIQHFGFTYNYVMVAGFYLLALVPIALLRETAQVPSKSAVAASSR
jgi:predicted MFS family arabinose efflux permease